MKTIYIIYSSSFEDGFENLFSVDNETVARNICNVLNADDSYCDLEGYNCSIPKPTYEKIIEEKKLPKNPDKFDIIAIKEYNKNIQSKNAEINKRNMELKNSFEESIEKEKRNYLLSKLSINCSDEIKNKIISIDYYSGNSYGYTTLNLYEE